MYWENWANLTKIKMIGCFKWLDSEVRLRREEGMLWTFMYQIKGLIEISKLNFKAKIKLITREFWRALRCSQWLKIVCRETFLFSWKNHITPRLKAITTCPIWDMKSRYSPRSFNQVRHQTTSAYIENKHFFTKSCYRQTYQNYEQPPQSLQNLYF